MSKQLRVLILEDEPSDAELMAYELKRAGMQVQWERVDNEADFLNRLTPELDAILSDYSMPQIGALRALELLNQRKLDVPVIVVSGTIGEDRAVATIQLGASDYLLKDRMARLSQAISRAIEQRMLRQEKRLAEEELQREVQRLAALRAVDMAISASFDIRVTLVTLLDHLVSLLGVSAASILRFNPRSMTLDYVAGRGFRLGSAGQSSQHVGAGLAGRVALERQMIQDEEMVRGARYAGEDFLLYIGAPLLAKGQIKGVLEVFSRRKMKPGADWYDLLNAMAVQAALAIDNAELFDSLQRSNVDLALAYEATLEGWARALEMRDHETEGHTIRAAELTVQLARALGLPEDELVHVRRGALLHDIGKMAIPDRILLKPGPLDDEEWKAMRLHPQYARDLLLSIAFLCPALDIPYCHHERWDGSGYPRRLRGEAIPAAARIFAVVDVWDALHSDRPYSKAWPDEQVRQYLKEQSAKQFEPRVVEAFLAMM